jgi:hypothetical protein
VVSLMGSLTPVIQQQACKSLCKDHDGKCQMVDSRVHKSKVQLPTLSFGACKTLDLCKLQFSSALPCPQRWPSTQQTMAPIKI